MNITIKTIPHEAQRYDTPGDWFFTPEGNLEIRVSDSANWREEALIAVHELVEVLICKHRGITQEQVDAFDFQYENDRALGKHSETDEPGDDLDAPYRREHCIATAVERLLAAELDIAWKDYGLSVQSFSQS